MSYSSIGLIGCGGRENAIGKTLIKNNNKLKLFYTGNHINIGLNSLGAFFENIDIIEPHLILKWAQNNKLELVIIGPEKPLESGVVDILEDNKIPCFGPRKDLAMLETSKIFCRNFLSNLEKKLDIKLNPEYYYYDNEKILIEHMNSYDKKFVIKQDMLAGGKGVLVMDDHFKTNKDGVQICMGYLNKNIPFHIEEKLEGEEFSLMSITDGINIQHCPPIQDYKRVFSGNYGPNTGGMGCIMNCLSFLHSFDIDTAEKINEAVINNIRDYLKTEHYYKGVLYKGVTRVWNTIILFERVTTWREERDCDGAGRQVHPC